MQIHTFIFIVLFFSMSFCRVPAQSSVSVTANELTNLNGCWTGTISHSGTMIRKPFSTTSSLTIASGSDNRQFTFLHIYSTQAGDQSADTVMISNDGRTINGAAVTAKKATTNGVVEIITEEKGMDEDYNQPVLVRKIYITGKNLFGFKKQIRQEGQTDWIDREEYNYTRSACSKKAVKKTR